MEVIGEIRGRMDRQGRAVLPVEIRPALVGRGRGERIVYIAPGQEQCLFVLSQTMWRDLTEKLKSASFARQDARLVTRFFFSSAARSRVDAQARITIPLRLQEYAGLSQDIYIIGVGTRVEIWDEARWKVHREQARQSYEERTERL